jgi:hypothetical protein
MEEKPTYREFGGAKGIYQRERLTRLPTAAVSGIFRVADAGRSASKRYPRLFADCW